MVLHLPKVSAHFYLENHTTPKSELTDSVKTTGNRHGLMSLTERNSVMSLAVRADRSWLRHFAFWQSPFGRRRILLMGLIVVACLASTYFAVYLKLLAAETKRVDTDPVTQKLVIITRPAYLFRNSLAPSQASWLEALLEPAHQFDRWIRPGTWPEPGWCKISPDAMRQPE